MSLRDKPALPMRLAFLSSNFFLHPEGRAVQHSGIQHHHIYHKALLHQNARLAVRDLNLLLFWCKIAIVGFGHKV